MLNSYSGQLYLHMKELKVAITLDLHLIFTSLGSVKWYTNKNMVIDITTEERFCRQIASHKAPTCFKYHLVTVYTYFPDKKI